MEIPANLTGCITCKHTGVKETEENSCIPPRVRRHHHLREECEKCEGENTVSGVQHVATGPAERPTHAAQSQLHTAADLRGGEKHRNRCTSARLEVRPARGSTEGAHIAECQMQQNAGKEIKEKVFVVPSHRRCGGCSACGDRCSQIWQPV